MGKILVVMLIGYLHTAFAYDPMAPPGFNKGTIDNAMHQSVSEKKKQVKTKTASAGFTLRQVVISPAGKSAVINGYIVNEGSYLNSAYVQSIEADQVIILVKGKTRTLTLKEAVPRIRR